MQARKLLQELQEHVGIADVHDLFCASYQRYFGANLTQNKLSREACERDFNEWVRKGVLPDHVLNWYAEQVRGMDIEEEQRKALTAARVSQIMHRT